MKFIGAWWDISNPVVAMSGTLRSDLWDWMEEWQDKADLTLCMGTSLVGMSADACVEDVARRYVDENEGYGAVIVGLQRTQYDEISSLRFYCKIDLMMSLLAKELNVIVPEYKTYEPKINPENIITKHVYKVPYNKNGKLTSFKKDMIVLDLRKDQKMVTMAGPGKGFKGIVVDMFPDTNHYSISTRRMRQGHPDHGVKKRTYYLGSWWIETLTEGKWDFLPLMNREPVLQTDWESN